MIRYARLLCMFMLAMGICSFASGQIPGTGLYTFGSFDSRGFDAINMGNLNVHFEIPIVSKPGRGENFNYSLIYDGQLWSAANGVWEPDASWGFKSSVANAGSGNLTYSRTTIPCGNGIDSFNFYNFAFQDSVGATHSFPEYTATQDCNGATTQNAPGFSFATDGSGLHLELTAPGQEVDPTWIVHTQGGLTIGPMNDGGSAVSTTDSNGNTITANVDGTFTDTLGTTALAITGARTPSSPVSLTYPVTLQADGATSASAGIYYQSYLVQTNFQCAGIVEYGQQVINLVDHVTLADGSTYSFTYEPTPGVSSGAVTGRLASITLPTGGIINYAYTAGCNGSGINVDSTVGSLTRTTSDGSRSYNRSPINSNATSTMVTDEAGNQSLYQFTTINNLFYETHRQIYQGALGGPNLFDLYTCYNGAQPPCDGAAIDVPILSINSLSSYNNGTQSNTINSYTATGLLTSSVLSYDGNIITSTANTYTDNTSGKLLQTTTSDGSGNMISSSSYGYDEWPATATSGVSQHLLGVGPLGNQTSSHIWTGSGSIDTQTYYYDTGSPGTIITPNGTSYLGYDPTYTFATTTTLPTPNSGVQLSTSANYDGQSGGLLSTTGMNAGQTTQIAQYDRLMRPTIINSPNGGQLNYLYYNPYQTGVYQKLNSSDSAQVQTLYDGYGRKSRVAIANDAQNLNSYYQTDYCYNATGRLQFQSLPYQGDGWNVPKHCSGSGTTYSYDALGRVTSSSNSDGSITYQYNGRTVLKTDVNGVQRMTQTDSLGRTSGICEISSNSNMPNSGTPVSCEMDIAGTGFVTTYSYDLANHKTTITQGTQQRVFQTDAIGRTIYTSEPERGVTTYSYTYNSTGLLVTRQRPTANQSNSNVLTTTTTQYDSLGRVISVNYSDGTDNKTFTYDVPTTWDGNSNPGASKGMLTLATVASAGTVYVYDLMGRIVWSDQCLPSGCGVAGRDKVITYSYDLGGNLASAGDGNGTTVQYGRTIAGEVNSVTSSMSNATAPSTLLSNFQQGPNGPSIYQFGSGLTGVQTYDSNLRLNGLYVCNGSSQISCMGGAQVYGTTENFKGSQVQGLADTALNQQQTFSYDEFNRLAETNIWSGQQTFNYVYDRYGNRWQQNAPQGGPSPQYSFDNNNHAAQIANDAAGNITNDGIHSYTYDAEGNVTQVDGGSTAHYKYDALNHRVGIYEGSTTREVVFNQFGQRASIWDQNNSFLQGQYYWGMKPIAFYTSDNALHFQHQDLLGTERMRTSYNGIVEGSYGSLPFGDNSSVSGTDSDTYHFAALDHDSESNTDHAQFRQYSNTLGRWLSPDPYDGSYRMGNPQSFNRYSYVINRPLSAADPSGLDECDEDFCDDESGGTPDCLAVLCTSVTVSTDPDLPPTTVSYPSTETIGNTPDDTAPNNPTNPQPCLAQQVGNAIPGAQYTGVGDAVGGHQQFNFAVNTADLAADGFTPFKVLGIFSNGYRNGSFYLQVHVNGQNGAQLSGTFGVVNVQGHIDVFNPAAGYGTGLILHGIWDLGIGSLFFHHSARLDPGCHS